MFDPKLCLSNSFSFSSVYIVANSQQLFTDWVYQNLQTSIVLRLLAICEYVIASASVYLPDWVFKIVKRNFLFKTGVLVQPPGRGSPFLQQGGACIFFRRSMQNKNAQIYIKKCQCRFTEHLYSYISVRK